ncbi:hypothetical protein UlMin_022966 [Ulmus minor]
MELHPFSIPTKLFFLQVLLVAIFLHPNEAENSETNLVFYMQDLASGDKATVVPVTGIAGKTLSFTSFGTIFAIDDPITETQDNKSAPIGRAQGMLLTSALDGSNVHVSISIVFTSDEYNGSTLELQGISKQNERYKEISVVSGTGSFRLARGYATLETIYYDDRTSFSVIRCSISVIRS